MSIAKQIESMINTMTDNNIPIKLVTIVRGYEREICDISTDNGIIKNIQCSNITNAGAKGLLLYLNGDENKPFVLLFSDLSDYYTKEEIDEMIGGTIPDLKQYVKKADLIDPTKYDIDLNMSFGISGLDDNIIIDMDIVDYIVNKTINTRRD